MIVDMFGTEVAMRLSDIKDACELLKPFASHSLLTLRRDSVRQCCSKYKARRQDK